MVYKVRESDSSDSDSEKERERGWWEMSFSVDPVLSGCLVYSKQSAKLCFIFHQVATPC